MLPVGIVDHLNDCPSLPMLLHEAVFFFCEAQVAHTLCAPNFHNTLTARVFGAALLLPQIRQWPVLS